jgi:imidazolonepropionase-like amidohydrolase
MSPRTQDPNAPESGEIMIRLLQVLPSRAALTLAASCAVVLAAPAAAQRPVLSESVREFVVADDRVIALTHVRVVDGTGAAPAENQTIVLTDGVISAVGPASSVRPPAGARVMDMAGHTVIPGLVGVHNHTFYTTATGRRAQLSFSAPRLYLASGVTTVRTTGSLAPYNEINMKRAIDQGEAIGPRMHITGPYLTGPNSGFMTGVATEEDARRIIRYWVEEGVQWFKAYTTIGHDEFRAAIAEAHRLGAKFTGHLCSVSFREAVALGIDNLEHGFFTNSDYVADKQQDECPQGMRASLLEVDLDGPEVQATFRDMIDHNVAMTSTLAVYELSYPDRPPLEQRVLDAMAPEAQAEYLATREAISRNAARSTTPQLFHKAQDYERRFVAAGGLLAAGVDPTGNGGALPGFGDQRNYELLIEAGFSPVETIRIMSLNGARVLGEDERLGSIAVGKLADLVVIRGDPVRDTAGIRNVTLVFKDGVAYDSARLIESVRGTVGIR